MDVFVAGFCFLTVLCIVLYVYTKTALTHAASPDFKKFQRVYLTVYLLAMGGDWLQGPHVYALYQSYDISSHSIQLLFVIGFGASMVVGTVVGSFADKYGRRANCILYGILYACACVTKHFGNFWVLLIGRLLGGTATSILYSAFESWLIYEHNQRGYDPELLSHTFSIGVLGNSLVAILAGLVAQWFADQYGFVAPFDISLTVLIVMCFVIIFTWSENYGDLSSSFSESFRSALKSIQTDKKVLCLGLIQSLFEGAMYMFVLEWTPALTPKDADLSGKTKGEHRGAIPHGIIFAAFMVAIMIGSSIFKILLRNWSPESFMRGVLVLSAVSLLLPVLFPASQVIVFSGFLIFECCVGIFWPSLGTMRGKYVPEKTRATIMNFFRIPLNMIVVLMLIQSLSMKVIFTCCCVFLFLASMFQQVLYQL
ncbi:molybdate-anion transporter-like isoform X2 [Liolophura sinensis]